MRIQRPIKQSLALLLALTPWACSPQAETKGQKAQQPSSQQGSQPKQPSFELRDVLAEWEQRFAATKPGSYDYQLPTLSDKRRQELFGMLDMATSTSRIRQRFATHATEELKAIGDEAAIAVTLWIESEGTTPEAAGRALELFHASPPAPLLSACLRWLDDPRTWLRIASYRLLASSGSPHPVPRLLRRLKYEEELAAFPYLCEALAELGSPAAIPHLIQRLGIEKQRAMAGDVLVRIVHRFGDQPYQASDGWEGLKHKAQAILRQFQSSGALLAAKRPPLGSPPDSSARPAPAGSFEPLTQREWWLLLKHLGGDPLRPVDDARFVGRRLGAIAVPLVKEALLAKNNFVRVHSLEIARELGLVAKSCGDAVNALLEDHITRVYAIETIGAIHDHRAIEIYELLLRPQNKSPLQIRVAALKGLARFGHPLGIAIARQLLIDTAQSVELRAWAAHAVDRCARGARQRARSFLQGLLDKGEFHGPTLRELLAK
ncbi:MAG: hypothetical protein CSA62_10720 [Planctomycetota bacterium]|nr:MAG: hypothetical protein CSA62_10720 [Planctomycetota bacterium]